MATGSASLEKAVTALSAVLARAEDSKLMSGLDETTRQAIEDADLPRTRKDLFRHAARHGLIEDPVPWFDFAEARSLTSQTYDLDQAAVVYTTAIEFAVAAAEYSRRLAERND